MEKNTITLCKLSKRTMIFLYEQFYYPFIIIQNMFYIFQENIIVESYEKMDTSIQT